MQLMKENEVINLENESHIRAFLQSGWKEIKKTQKQTKSSKNSRDKDET